MNAAITSVYMVIAVWIPVIVVPRSSATVAIDTFITELSSIIRNCPAHSVNRTIPAAAAPALRPKEPLSIATDPTLAPGSIGRNEQDRSPRGGDRWPDRRREAHRGRPGGEDGDAKRRHLRRRGGLWRDRRQRDTGRGLARGARRG